MGRDAVLLPLDDKTLALLRGARAPRDLRLRPQVPLPLPDGQAAPLVRAAGGGAGADHEKPHRGRPPLPGDHDQHHLLLRPRRPGVRRLLRGRRPGDVPRPGQRAAPDRVERVHRARDPDLHLRGDVGPQGAGRARRHGERRLRGASLRLRPRPAFPILPRPMTQIGTPENPLRVAIVGAGPSGFYAAEHILKGEDVHAQVDLFDRLPTPFGLVRGGVAPDHPKIKSVIRVYEKTAAREGFRFFGNVKVGHDIEVDDLERHYHAIVFTVGCETDRQLGIPGEELPGSHAATAFVGWYNAHPDYADDEFDLSCERAVVIGNGNVAMDVARMLALTDHELRQTDTADHAIEMLDAKQIREIVVLGRRGPVQAAFTNPEIKELGEMEDADVIVDPADVELDPASAAFLESDEVDKTTRVNVETLREFSQRTPEGKHQRIVLRFLASPIEIKGDGKVESIVIGRNELVEENGALRAKDTGEREELECGLVLRSVGYTGIPIEGVPFDQKRGLILNEGGRVLDSHDAGHKVGHYTAGWIKRGPSGVIGTNKKDALETVQHLLADVEAGILLEPADPSPSAVEDLLAERGVRYVSFEDWQAIDQAEVGRGEPHGRPRVKFVRVEEMLSTLGEKLPG